MTFQRTASTMIKIRITVTKRFAELEVGVTSVKLQALSLSLLAAFGLFHFHNAFTFTLRPLCNSFQAFISLKIKVLDVMVKCPPRLYQRPNNNPHPNTPQVSPMHLVRIQKAEMRSLDLEMFRRAEESSLSVLKLAKMSL
jgi:hypothetical protein